MMGLHPGITDFVEALGILAVLGLAAFGIVCAIACRSSDDDNEPWRQQERRLENEEDTRDQGPI
jgi:hypothetical protein